MKKDKDIDMDDAFSKQIRQKLVNHTMPVDDMLWKGIQQRITPLNKIIPWWAYASVSAVAAIALLITVGSLILYQQRKDVSPEVALNDKILLKETHQETVQLVDHYDKLVVTAVIPIEATTKLDKMLDVPTDKALNPVVDVLNPEVGITTTAKSDNELIALATSPIPSPEEAAVEVTTGEQVQPSTVLKEKLKTLEADWTKLIKKKDESKMMLAAGFGSGIASSSATIPGRSRAYRQQGLVGVKTNYNSVLTPNDFSEKHYLPPVTVGLSVRLPLNTHFSLESGLLYTYLTTRLSGSTSTQITSAESNLHYLGLPLNLISSLFKGNRWEIYVSTGATVEKGLRSEFRQYQDNGNSLFSTTANTSIDGLQWSLNASLGVAYHLNQHLSLYLDPKLSYYFENEQPYSIRSDMPMLVGLNTGLRITL